MAARWGDPELASVVIINVRPLTDNSTFFSACFGIRYAPIHAIEQQRGHQILRTQVDRLLRQRGLKLYNRTGSFVGPDKLDRRDVTWRGQLTLLLNEPYDGISHLVCREDDVADLHGHDRISLISHRSTGPIGLHLAARTVRAAFLWLSICIFRALTCG